MDAADVAAPTGLVARVLVDSPLPQLDRLFDYAIPQSLREAVTPGIRVTVPLRSAGRIAEAYVVEVTEAGEYAGPLSTLESVVSPVRVLTEETWALARRLADRAAGSAGDILRLAIPKRQVRVEKAFLAREAAPKPAATKAAGIIGYGDRTSIEPGERLAWEAIPHPVALDDGTWVGAWALTLAQAAASTLAAGRSVILAVPDYRDQDQLEAALATLLPAEAVVRMDARQSNPDRYRAFLRCLDEAPVVVVGNRSAVYAPVGALGLLAVWDDGDALHSEPLSPYVHTRDAALVRQEQSGAALVFASLAPSTEVQRLVELGFLQSVLPSPRILPKVVPTSQQVGEERLAQQARIPSGAWRAAAEALKEGPVLVQVARPGYAPRLACTDCGEIARCRRCEGPLGQRSATSPPSCAWCGALAARGWTCPHCQGTRMRMVGAGSGRTADELGRAFPGVRVIVADGDHPVQRVDAKPALVIATRGAEPIAEGGYRAVLLLDGERMLQRESLRVAEDCVRWWTSAIALAAPKATSVLVGVGEPFASALATWRLDGFAARELADRRELRFPPAVRVATVTGSVDDVESLIADTPVAAGDVLGPVDLGDGKVRSILRFDYSKGAEVAAALRAATVKAATSRRRAAGRGAPRAAVRVRVDDVEPFLDA